MTTEMKGRNQLNRAGIARAQAQTVWNILLDSRLLPTWAPVVREVEACDTTGESVGAVRRCRVELAGKPGAMVERCIGLEPGRHIAYLVEDESFGMRRILADYGFTISLEPLGTDRTRVTIESFYTPRNAAYSLMNAIFMRPRFRRVVDDLLAGLIRLAEAGSAPG
jgi:hypothetical protein